MLKYLTRIRIVVLLGVFIVAVAFLFPFPEFDYHSYSLARSRKPNAVIYLLLSPSRITQATMALLNVEDRFNRRLKYPYVLFLAEDETDIITEELKAKVNWITEGRATFATIPNEDWGVPDFLERSRVDDSLQNIGFSLGYRSMCRFYSGFFWKQPALASYEWLWRLDTDIEFHCDVPYDPIEVMISRRALYGFVQITQDATFVQPSLASNVSLFLSENAHLVPADANQGFVWNGQTAIERAMNGVATTDDWTKECMYNNFEISHRSVWEGELYSRFSEFLDRSGGYFYERWGDSPVHAFGIAMSLRKDQVIQFGDMGYQHQGWAYGCPDLDRCACIKDGAAVDFNDRMDRWFNPQA